MGTWAEGNFSNDGALDYLGGLIDSFVQTIEEVIEDEDRVSLDEDGEAVLVPSVAIISLLCKHFGGAPPKEETIQKWHKKYLLVYDQQIDGLLRDPESDYKKKRREIIDTTFKELEEQAGRFWKE